MQKCQIGSLSRLRESVVAPKSNQEKSAVCTCRSDCPICRILRAEAGNNHARQSNETHPTTIELETGQVSSRVSAGVDINPVSSHLRLCYRRMPVNDDLAKRPLVSEELPAYPKQIDFTLALEWNSRTH